MCHDVHIVQDSNQLIFKAHQYQFSISGSHSYLLHLFMRVFEYKSLDNGAG